MSQLIGHQSIVGRQSIDQPINQTQCMLAWCLTALSAQTCYIMHL